MQLNEQLVHSPVSQQQPQQQSEQCANGNVVSSWSEYSDNTRIQQHFRRPNLRNFLCSSFRISKSQMSNSAIYIFTSHWNTNSNQKVKILIKDQITSLPPIEISVSWELNLTDLYFDLYFAVQPSTLASGLSPPFECHPTMCQSWLIGIYGRTRTAKRNKYSRYYRQFMKEHWKLYLVTRKAIDIICSDLTILFHC